jgi:hypothetical protein
MTRHPPSTARATLPTRHPLLVRTLIVFLPCLAVVLAVRAAFHPLEGNMAYLGILLAVLLPGCVLGAVLIALVLRSVGARHTWFPALAWLAGTFYAVSAGMESGLAWWLPPVGVGALTGLWAYWLSLPGEVIADATDD